jgi:hypothetical protein
MLNLRYSRQPVRNYTYIKENLARETPDIVRFICWCILVCLVEKVQEQFDESTK